MSNADSYKKDQEAFFQELEALESEAEQAEESQVYDELIRLLRQHDFPVEKIPSLHRQWTKIFKKRFRGDEAKAEEMASRMVEATIQAFIGHKATAASS